MREFFLLTFTNPAYLWSALEAVATSLAAIVIFWQLRRLRQEAVAHKVEGLKYAMEIVGSNDFQDKLQKLNQVLYNGDPFQFGQTLLPIVQGLLQSLEIVDLLIKTGYLEEQFFFRIEGLRLAELSTNIRLLEEGKDTPRFEDQISLYPNGRALLRRADDWMQRLIIK